MTEADASEATIQLMYKSYYARWAAPECRPRSLHARANRSPIAATSPAFRRPPARPKPVESGIAGQTGSYR
jgi:hypothetical protein